MIGIVGAGHGNVYIPEGSSIKEYFVKRYLRIII